RIVEVGMPEQLYSDAQHPYTRGLRASFPPLSEPVRRLRGIPGTPPDLLNLPTGCAFSPRCPLAVDRCRTERPELTATETGVVACHRAGERDDRAPPETATGEGGRDQHAATARATPAQETSRAPTTQEDRSARRAPPPPPAHRYPPRRRNPARPSSRPAISRCISAWTVPTAKSLCAPWTAS